MMNWSVVAHCKAKNNGKIEHFESEVAQFSALIHAEEFIKLCLPKENQDKFEIKYIGK